MNPKVEQTLGRLALVGAVYLVLRISYSLAFGG